MTLFDTYGYITDTVPVDDDGQWGLVRSLFGGHNTLYAVAENAFGAGPESNHVLVSLVPKPPLYPPTIHNGQVVTFSANARDNNPAEGRPTVAVTATLAGEEVGLSLVSSQGITGTWLATRPVSGLNNGDCRVVFIGIDEDGYVGDGESTLRVKDPPRAPEFTYPTETITRATPTLNVTGEAQPLTTLRLYCDGELTATIELGSVGSWIVPLTLGDGTHAITATATDDVGQVSLPGTAGTVIVDTVPPTATLEALTPYQNQQTITLRWDGSDPAPGSGVAGYDLQHRLGTGSWETILAGTTLTETQYWAVEGTHTFRARDGAHNESAWSAETSTVVDVTPPTTGLASITEDGPYAHASGDTIYYGPGSGTFTVTVTAGDALAGLEQVEFPTTVSVGGVHTTAGPQFAHTYTFTLSSTEEGAYQTEVYDRAGNDAEVPFTVTRDCVAPVAGVSVPGKVPTGTFTVEWSGSDQDSGVADYDVQVKVDDGDWTSWLTATIAQMRLCRRRGIRRR